MGRQSFINLTAGFLQVEKTAACILVLSGLINHFISVHQGQIPSVRCLSLGSASNERVIDLSTYFNHECYVSHQDELRRMRIRRIEKPWCFRDIAT